MTFDLSRYRVKLAGTDIEREGAQRLRHEVFVNEMGARGDGRDAAARLERDAHDERADHLILVDEGAGREDPRDAVVGTYRLIRGGGAADASGFYSAAEYDLSGVLASGRTCVELSRSCVARAHRGGAALHLLWNGLAEYVAARRIEIVFGVGSFPGRNPAAHAEALSYLRQRHLATSDLLARAWPERYVDMDMVPAERVDPARALLSVPPLLRAYLRLGGMIGDGACVDDAFNTVDVFVAMDTARMAERYQAHLARAAGARS